MGSAHEVEWLPEFAWDVANYSKEQFLRREPDSFLVLEGIQGVRIAPGDGPNSPADMLASLMDSEEAGGFQTMEAGHGAEMSRDPRSSYVLRVRKTNRNEFLGMITVGRSRNNDIVLRVKSISKFHAYFMKTAQDELALYDASSQNGTFVRHERLLPRQPCPLANDLEIRLGADVFLRYYSPEGLYDFFVHVRRVLSKEQLRKKP